MSDVETIETIENAVYGICLEDCPAPGMPEFLTDLRAFLDREGLTERCSWYLILEDTDRMAVWIKRLEDILGFDIPEDAEIIWTGPEDYRIGTSDTPSNLLILGFHSVYVHPREWEQDLHCSQWSEEFVRRASIYTWAESAT